MGAPEAAGSETSSAASSEAGAEPALAAEASTTSSAACSAADGTGAKSSGVNTGALIAALAPIVIGMVKSGGLQKMMSGFQQQGMGKQADSWVSTGPNEGVNGSEMRVGLGDGEVRQFAQAAGLPEDEAADVLAAVVPQVVNGLTPNGELPSDEELEARLRQALPAA